MTSFLWRLYVHCFVDELMLIYPFYAVMFVDHGMTPLQISTLLASWSAITLVLEVPSGALADRFSRKHLMVIGAALRAVAYACWALYPGFWGFLAGFLLWGTESALGSGAFEALVYDELKHARREADYARIMGRCRSLGLAGVVVSALLASLVADMGYGALLAASCVAALVAGLLLWSLPTAVPVARLGVTGWTAYVATLRAGLGTVLLRPAVRHVVVFSSVVLALGGTMEEYWTIFLRRFGTPHVWLGVALAVCCSVQALASLLAHRFVTASSRTAFVTLAISGLLLWVAGQAPGIGTAALILVFLFVYQTIDVVYDARLQSAIDSAHRATASSVKSFGSEVTGIVVVLAMGGLATHGSYETGYEGFAFAVIVLGGLYMLLSLRRGHPMDDTRLPHSGAGQDG